MAKAKKVQKSQDRANPADPGRSVLKASWQAFERGDMVAARELSRSVLAGRSGKDDPRVAEELSKLLSVEGDPKANRAVGTLPEDVAREIISRTQGPPRPYLFALLAATLFGLLLTLALSRY